MCVCVCVCCELFLSAEQRSGTEATDGDCFLRLQWQLTSHHFYLLHLLADRPRVAPGPVSTGKAPPWRIETLNLLRPLSRRDLGIHAANRVLCCWWWWWRRRRQHCSRIHGVVSSLTFLASAYSRSVSPSDGAFVALLVRVS